MSMAYVREHYAVPVGLHVLVKPLSGRFKGDEMLVTSCTHLVHARHHFKPQIHRFHPLDLEYRTGDGWFNPRDKNTSRASPGDEGEG